MSGLPVHIEEGPAHCRKCCCEADNAEHHSQRGFQLKEELPSDFGYPTQLPPKACQRDVLAEPANRPPKHICQTVHTLPIPLT